MRRDDLRLKVDAFDAREGALEVYLAADRQRVDPVTAVEAAAEPGETPRVKPCGLIVLAIISTSSPSLPLRTLIPP